MNPKYRFFELAKKLSRFSTHRQHKLGCVIVDKNRVVSLGFNKMCTHTRSPHPYKSLHAEIAALLKMEGYKSNNCIAYVYRETRDGKPAMGKPCLYCASALITANVKGVFYTVANKTGWEYMELKG